MALKFKNYHKEKNQFKQRVIKAAVVIAALIIVLLVRLFNLQIVNHKLYSNLADNNKLEYIPIEPNRGIIYDRNGVLLAENVPLFSLTVVPEAIKNINETIKELQKIITISPKDLKQFHVALKQRRHYEYIPLKLKLTQEEVAIFYLNQYRFPGVGIDAKMMRYYPLAEAMASVVGYVGRINVTDLKNLDANNYRATNFIGKIGIEKYFEKELHGTTGFKVAEVSAKGRITKIKQTIQPIHGDTLFLTVDSNLQKIAQDALGEEKGSVVAIDPNNGEILALVSHPGFDPNLFTNGIDNDTFNKLQFSADRPMYNRATLGAYPFGSTIKPFIALQGLDTNTINTGDTVWDPGWFKLPNARHLYRCWIHGGHGSVNVIKAIIVSCDTFFYTLSTKLGIEKIDNILWRFGFGKKLNIEISEEFTGIVASPEWKQKYRKAHWYLGDTVISAIGQGFMSTTPLQLAHGAATIAMHGQRFKPRLLFSTKKSDGSITKPPITNLPSVSLKNNKHWDTVISAMRDVMSSQEGTAKKRFGINPIPAYTVAGKTGGSQLFHHKIVNENATPQSEDSIPKHLRNHNLFIAFAPIENPKIAIAVVTENSNIAVQTARKVLDAYLLPDQKISFPLAN